VRYNVQDNTPTSVCEQRVISEATVAREWTIAKAWLRANLSDPLAFQALRGVYPRNERFSLTPTRG